MNSGAGSRFIQGSIPVGPPFLVPQNTTPSSGSLPIQAFPYFGGVIYQPMMPMLFQPNVSSQQQFTNHQKVRIHSFDFLNSYVFITITKVQLSFFEY